MEKEYFEALRIYAGQTSAYATSLLVNGHMTEDEHLEFTKGFTELTKALVKLEPKENENNTTN